MKEYIIRTKSGTERCIVADNMNINYIKGRAYFWYKYGYTEYNGEYYNYYINRDVTEIPLRGIATIGVIKYEQIISGKLEIIYDASKEQENETNHSSLSFGSVLAEVMKNYE